MDERDVRYSFFSGDLMREIRNHFYYVDHCPYSGPRIFLDSASGSLLLKSMVEALCEETQLPDQLDRDNAASSHVHEVLSQALEDVRVFLGAEGGHFMVGQSSSHAVFSVVEACVRHIAGSNVVTTALEHPSVYDATHYFSKEMKKEWRVANLSPKTGSVLLEDLLEKIDSDTSLLAIIHASNITGTIHDLKEIIVEARKIKPDLVVITDGVQYAPHGLVDVMDLGVDAYILGPYKAYCTKGISFAYLNDRVASLPHWKLIGKPTCDWKLGSQNHAAYRAWSKCVEYICWLGSQFTSSTTRREQISAGMAAIKSHSVSLLRHVLYGDEQQRGLLLMPHVQLYGFSKEDSLGFRNSLLAFNLEGYSSDEAVSLYSRERIRIHNRKSDVYSRHILEALGVSDVVRFSACHYNTKEEMDHFLAVTERLKR